jgi:hypothetical protein
MEGSTVRNPPCRSDYRPGDELLDGSPWAVEDDAAEEAAVVAVQTRIARMSDSELGELALHASPLTASVELATLRLFGALIRAALRRSDATLTDDERTLVECVRETIEEESRHA